MLTRIRIIPAIVFLLAGLLLSGLPACSSHEPVRHLTSDISLLTPNYTTRKDVLAYLGEPDVKRAGTEGGETWIYYQVNRSTLRKTPYVGDRLGYEVYDVVTITFAGDIVKAREYRLLSEAEFKKAGLKAGAEQGSK